jgi:mono/diheme cytochrome c family protein
MSDGVLRVTVLALSLLGCAGVAPLSPPAGEPEPAAPAYSPALAAQLERGKAQFAQSCGDCHAAGEFQGTEFEFKWRRRTAWELFGEISRTMPEDRPGKLAPETYADVVAYLLSVNGYALGREELSARRESLAAIALAASTAQSAVPGAKPKE